MCVQGIALVKGPWTDEVSAFALLSAAFRPRVFDLRSPVCFRADLPSSHLSTLCSHPAPCSLSRLSRPFQEDAKVLDLVSAYGAKRWSLIASHLPGRIGKQCRERWYARRLHAHTRTTPTLYFLPAPCACASLRARARPRGASGLSFPACTSALTGARPRERTLTPPMRRFPPVFFRAALSLSPRRLRCVAVCGGLRRFAAAAATSGTTT